MNWSRIIGKAVRRTARASKRYVSKPYRTEKARSAAAKKKRSTWR